MSERETDASDLGSAGSRDVPTPSSVILVDRGRVIEVPETAANAEFLRRVPVEVGSMLEGAEAVLRLAVSEATMARLRQSEVVLEIHFEETQSFVIAGLRGRSEAGRRLLVPLTGELAHEMATIFVGDREYRSGPYRNPRGIGALRRLVEDAVPAVRESLIEGAPQQ